MKRECKIRKRIWEVDCVSLDAVFATAFDWKELVNLLQNHRISVRTDLPDHVIEMQVQHTVHRMCHNENSLSCAVENILNRLYEGLMEQISNLNACQAHTLISNVDFANAKKLGGLFWAMGSDPRKEMEGSRRYLHQRSQITLLRKLKFSGQAII